MSARKLRSPLQQVEHLALVIKNYLELIKFCDNKGIEIGGRQPLDYLRRPDGPAGPNSDLLKLMVLFQNGISQIATNIHYTHKDEVEARMETAKPRFGTEQ